MKPLVFSRQARSDLLDIWCGIAALNAAAADHAIDRIETASRNLRRFPSLGPRRPDIFKDCRILIVDRWLLLYQVDLDVVRIVRVLDGRRDLTKIDPKL